MTNYEFYKEKTLAETLAAYDKVIELGYDNPIMVWLHDNYHDFSKGKFVRGEFWANEDVEEKIRKMENRTTEGYLLEYRNKESGKWEGSELDVGLCDGNLYDGGNEAAADDWFDNEVWVGFFKDMPEVWFEPSDDWKFRLDVDFDSRYTPTKKPNADGVWSGVTKEGDEYRVRKVSFRPELSDKAKEFFRRNPDIVFNYAKD